MSYRILEESNLLKSYRIERLIKTKKGKEFWDLNCKVYVYKNNTEDGKKHIKMKNKLTIVVFYTTYINYLNGEKRIKREFKKKYKKYPYEIIHVVGITPSKMSNTFKKMLKLKS